MGKTNDRFWLLSLVLLAAVATGGACGSSGGDGESSDKGGSGGTTGGRGGAAGRDASVTTGGNAGSNDGASDRNEGIDRADVDAPSGEGPDASGPDSGTIDAVKDVAGTDGGGLIVLDPKPGKYGGTCDGSGAVALDADYFLDANDEDQVLRVYRRGASATFAQTFDVGSKLDASDEVDLEEAARIGNRVYVIASHGRNKDGELATSRYRFFAADLSGTAPTAKLAFVGKTDALLQQLLVSSNWATPNPTVLSLLEASTQLAKATVASLAPEVDGLNIEGLAALPTSARPNQLLIGLRGPQSMAKAIVISLINADEVVTGATAKFGEARLLELGGLGIRGMAWSPVHQQVLILAGPHGSGGPFRIYKWQGDDSAPVLVVVVKAPADSSPEAIVVYPNTKDVQVLLDQGDAMIGSATCKDAPAASRVFSDIIVHID